MSRTCLLVGRTTPSPVSDEMLLTRVRHALARWTSSWRKRPAPSPPRAANSAGASTGPETWAAAPLLLLRATAMLLLGAGLLLLLLLVTRPAEGAGLGAPAPFVWIGAASDTGFVVRVDVHSLLGAPAVVGGPALRVATAPDLGRPAQLVWPSAEHDKAPYTGMRRYEAEGLAPGTVYYFGISTVANASEADGVELNRLLGSVATFPPIGSRADVHLGFGSCQKRASSSESLTRLADIAPRASNTTAVLMLHLGDLHYRDINEDDPSRFKDAITAVVTDPGAVKLFSSRLVAYMYDDHDYAANNGDKYAASRTAAMTNFQKMVPFGPVHVADGQSDLRNYHAFSVASVRIIVTDLRSEADKNAGILMSPTQLQWFFGELSRASSYSVVIWASTRPWIGKNTTSMDYWGAFPEQRATIANFIAEKRIANLVLVAGDAHMLAADDGTNSDYSRDGLPPAGFPVFHSSPFAARGSSKGGPFSEGCFSTRLAYNYHFATLEVSRVGESDGPCVSYVGYSTHSRDPVVQYRKCGALSGVAGKPGGGQEQRCKIRSAPPWLIAVGVIAILLIVIILGAVACALVRFRTKLRRK